MRRLRDDVAAWIDAPLTHAAHLACAVSIIGCPRTALLRAAAFHARTSLSQAARRGQDWSRFWPTWKTMGSP